MKKSKVITEYNGTKCTVEIDKEISIKETVMWTNSVQDLAKRLQEADERCIKICGKKCQDNCYSNKLTKEDK